MASSKKSSKAWTPAQRKNFMRTIKARKAQRAKMPDTTAPDHLPDSIDAEFEEPKSTGLDPEKLAAIFTDEVTKYLVEENKELRKNIHDLKVRFHEAVHEMSGTILRLLKGEQL